jgi:hypothetical protein
MIVYNNNIIQIAHSKTCIEISDLRSQISKRYYKENSVLFKYISNP